MTPLASAPAAAPSPTETPSTTAPNNLNIETMNDAFGGLFSARLNMNLREDKHWAYGSYSSASGAMGQRPWMAFAAVQIDKTAESVAEIKREMAEFFGGPRGTTAEELVRQQKEKARAEVKKNTTDVLDKKTAGLKEAKQNTNAALGKQTADLKQTQDKVNQTRKDVKAVAKDPVKAAATAVINQG